MTKEQYRVLERICIWGYIVLLGICMLVSTIQLLKPNNNITTPEPMSLTIEFVGRDSLPEYSQAKINEIDSIVKRVNEQYAFKCDESLNNLRQETNNLINKMNGWLSFWLCLLTIIAGIIPLCLQYKFNQESKEVAKEREAIREKKNAKLKDDLEKGLKEEKTKIEKSINEITKEKKELTQQNKELHDQLEKDKKEYQLLENQLKLNCIISSLLNAKENKLIDNSVERDVLLSKLMHELYEKTKCLFASIAQKSDDPNVKDIINTSLIQLFTVFKYYQRSLVLKSRFRKIDLLLDHLKKIISELNEGRISTNQLGEELNQLEAEISKSIMLFASNEKL